MLVRGIAIPNSGSQVEKKHHLHSRQAYYFAYGSEGVLQETGISESHKLIIGLVGETVTPTDSIRNQ
jgi:hypothetical protein